MLHFYLFYPHLHTQHTHKQYNTPYDYGCLFECVCISLNGSIYDYSRCHKLYFVHTKHIRCCVCQWVCVCISNAVQTNVRCLRGFSRCFSLSLSLSLSLSIYHFSLPLPIFFLAWRLLFLFCLKKPKYTIQFRLNHHHHHRVCPHKCVACVRLHASLIYQMSQFFSAFCMFLSLSISFRSHWFIFEYEVVCVLTHF